MLGSTTDVAAHPEFAGYKTTKILQLEEGNARQVVTRARQYVVNGRRHPANSGEHGRLLEAFIAAARIGDVAGLERFCATTSRRFNAEGQQS